MKWYTMVLGIKIRNQTTLALAVGDVAQAGASHRGGLTVRTHQVHPSDAF